MHSTSPHVKQDKPYSQSPQYKKPHPYNPEASISLKNSINLKDFQFNEELEYYKNRSIDLEQYVRQLKNELDTTIIRLSKQGAMDEKVELVLHQNQILSGDLDKLQKSFAQKKTECELWKSKYEQQLNSAVQLKAQYELDLRKLSNELKLLEERNSILEKERNHDVEATKTNLSLQNEQQRHGYLTQIDLMENQLRKLRDYADIRDKEVFELENRLGKVLNDRDLVEGKLLKENDLLRTRYAEQERDHQIELNNVRQKLDILNQGQLENLKNQYLTQVEIMENELDKIKGLLDIKNTEIETLIVQNQRLRANYDEEIQTIRLQFDMLKEKMLENEQQFQEESQQMENNLRTQHEIQIEDHKKHQTNQVDSFSEQIKHLKDQNAHQTQQLDDFQKIRQQLLQANYQDQENAQNIINSLKKEIQIQSSNYQDQINKNYQNYTLQTNQLDEYNQKQQQLIDQLQNQIENLNTIISLKDNQMEQTLNQFKELNNQLNSKLNSLYNDNESLKAKFNATQQEQEQQLNKQLHTIKQQEQKFINFENKVKNQIQQQSQQIDTLKQLVRQKDQSINTLRSQLQASEQNIQNLNDELQQTINDYKVQIDELKYESDQKFLQSIETHDQQLEIIKNELLETQSTLQDELVETKSQLRTQQSINSENQKKFQYLEEQVEEVFNNSDLIKQSKLFSEIKLTNRLQK